MLEEEFNFLINKKVNFTFFYWRSFLLSALNSANYIWYLVFEMCLQDQMNIESKIRNIRFIGELCKFKIAPPGLVFSCLKVQEINNQIINEG